MATILFDIDRTLFDTTKFLADVQLALVMLMGVTHEEFEEADRKYKDSLGENDNFVPEDYVQTLSEHFGASYDRIYETYFKRERFKSCVYYDVFESIEQLSRKHEVGIYTEGDEEFQRFKLGTLGLSLFLNPDLEFILNNKVSESSIKILPKDSYIVDDSIRILEKLNDADKFECVWINRKDEKEDDTFPTIHELDDIPKIIKD